MMENVLCDPCFTRLKSSSDTKFCDECQDMVDRYCFCCDTIQAEPVDFLCDSCIEELNSKPTCYMNNGDRIPIHEPYSPHQWATI